MAALALLLVGVACRVHQEQLGRAFEYVIDRPPVDPGALAGGVCRVV